MMGRCIDCGEYRTVVQHHEDYAFKDVTVTVCVPCHQRRHKLEPSLRRPKGYQQHQGVRAVKINKSSYDAVRTLAKAERRTIRNTLEMLLGDAMNVRDSVGS